MGMSLTAGVGYGVPIENKHILPWYETGFGQDIEIWWEEINDGEQIETPPLLFCQLGCFSEYNDAVMLMIHETVQVCDDTHSVFNINPEFSGCRTEKDALINAFLSTYNIESSESPNWYQCVSCYA